MTFDIGDILATGEFHNPALITEKHWDDDMDEYIYTIQYLHNGAIDFIIHDAMIALTYEG
jgi:hypothetical protein